MIAGCGRYKSSCLCQRVECNACLQNGPISYILCPNTIHSGSTACGPCPRGRVRTQIVWRRARPHETKRPCAPGHAHVHVMGLPASPLPSCATASVPLRLPDTHTHTHIHTHTHTHTRTHTHTHTHTRNRLASAQTFRAKRYVVCVYVCERVCVQAHAHTHQTPKGANTRGTF